MLLLGLALYPLLIDRMTLPKPSAFRDYNLARIASFDQAFPKGEALRVIAIGNSRLKHATLDDDAMTELAATLGEGRFGWLHLVNSWAVFEDFEPLTDRLLAIRPDAIVLQLDLLSVERAAPSRNHLKREYLTWTLFGYGPWHPFSESPENVQHYRPCRGLDPETHIKTRIPITQGYLTDDQAGPSGRQAKAFIGAAAKAGIPVIAMAIPGTAIMERTRPSDQRPFLDALDEAREASGEIPLLRYPNAIPDDGFCDSVHMNEAGQATFSRWLIGELSGRFR